MRVGLHPLSLRLFTALYVSSIIFPTAIIATCFPSINVSLLPITSSLFKFSNTLLALPLENLIAIGPLYFWANSNAFSNSLPFLGAIMVMLGIFEKNDISNIPWWVSPSFPTNPALSIMNVTGKFCKHTSCIIWSYALW